MTHADHLTPRPRRADPAYSPRHRRPGIIARWLGKLRPVTRITGPERTAPAYPPAGAVPLYAPRPDGMVIARGGTVTVRRGGGVLPRQPRPTALLEPPRARPYVRSGSGR